MTQINWNIRSMEVNIVTMKHPVQSGSTADLQQFRLQNIIISVILNAKHILLNTCHQTY